MPAQGSEKANVAVTLQWECLGHSPSEIKKLDDEARIVLGEWLDSVGYSCYELLPSNVVFPEVNPDAGEDYFESYISIHLALTPEPGYEHDAFSLKGKLDSLIRNGRQITQTAQARALKSKVLERYVSNPNLVPVNPIVTIFRPAISVTL